MRLWSIHPKYLDQKGLGALWREALLAKAVLEGKTKGYRNHPQLDRFKACDAPLAAIKQYLLGVWCEANARGYRYDVSKVDGSTEVIQSMANLMSIPVTIGQMGYEAEWLAQKIKTRTGERPSFLTVGRMMHDPHPLFRIVPGPTEPWEKINLRIPEGMRIQLIVAKAEKTKIKVDKPARQR